MSSLQKRGCDSSWSARPQFLAFGKGHRRHDGRLARASHDAMTARKRNVVAADGIGAWPIDCVAAPSPWTRHVSRWAGAFAVLALPTAACLAFRTALLAALLSARAALLSVAAFSLAADAIAARALGAFLLRHAVAAFALL